jgi:hypothetical protein
LCMNWIKIVCCIKTKRKNNLSSWKKQSQQDFSVSFSQARKVDQEKTRILSQIFRGFNSK